jgi:hypothetical protein
MLVSSYREESNESWLSAENEERPAARVAARDVGTVVAADAVRQ